MYTNTKNNLNHTSRWKIIRRALLTIRWNTATPVNSQTGRLRPHDLNFIPLLWSHHGTTLGWTSSDQSLHHLSRGIGTSWRSQIILLSLRGQRLCLQRRLSMLSVLYARLVVYIIWCYVCWHWSECSLFKCASGYHTNWLFYVAILHHGATCNCDDRPRQWISQWSKPRADEGLWHRPPLNHGIPSPGERAGRTFRSNVGECPVKVPSNQQR